MNPEDERRTQQKMESPQHCNGNYDILHQELKKKRLDWWEINKDNLNLSGSLPRQAYEMVLFRYMKISPEEIPIVEETENRITWVSSNFCPILEACKKLGLDTRVVCKQGAEQSVQDLISKLSPNLIFSRNYKDLRPYGKYCEESFELRAKNNF
jgi:tRNA(adenine34) deaminase